MTMTPIVALLAAAPASATGTLDASARAHANLRRFHAVATVEITDIGKRSRVEYDLVADGETFRIRIREGAGHGRGRADRSFYFTKTQALGYDAVANERLSRRVPPEAKRLGRLIFTVGPVDDLIRFLLDGSQMGDFYGNFRRLQGWKISSNANGTNLKRSVRIGSTGTNSTSLTFARKTNLLTFLDIRTPKTSTRWTVRYLSPTTPGLNIPRSAREVTSFTVDPEPPKFTTTASKTLAERTLRAYRELRRGTISVRDESGRTTIWLDGDRLREENPAVSFAYDGKTLTIVNPRVKKIFRGPIERSKVPTLFASLRYQIDPFSRQILQDRVPLQELMVPDMAVSTGGSVEMNGAMCDILKFDNPRTRVMLCIRRDNHLLDSSTTNTVDRSGMPLVTTARRFAYQRLGQRPNVSFTIPNKPGYTIAKLPKIRTR